MGRPAEVKLKNIVKAIEDGFFSEAEYALRRKVHPRTLQRENAKGIGVKPTIIHKKRFYDKHIVYEYERDQKKRSKSATAVRQ